MTASPDYDGPLSALRSHVEDLGASLGIWENCTEPDAHARRCASDAMDAIDAAISNLHAIRARLLSEIRAAADATASRVDALLRVDKPPAGHEDRPDENQP